LAKHDSGRDTEQPAENGGDEDDPDEPCVQPTTPSSFAVRVFAELRTTSEQPDALLRALGRDDRAEQAPKVQRSAPSEEMK
jgi:hypothetical protein